LKPKRLYGSGSATTEAEKYILLRVLREPRQKSWQKLQKCHHTIICFGFLIIKAY